MPFPSAGTAPKKVLPKKGKSRSRRYEVWWCYREEPSNDDSTLYVAEVKSTNVQSVRTALLRALNTDAKGNPVKEKDKLRGTDVVLIQARVLARGETIPGTEEEE